MIPRAGHVYSWLRMAFDFAWAALMVAVVIAIAAGAHDRALLHRLIAESAVDRARLHALTDSANREHGEIRRRLDALEALSGRSGPEHAP